VPCCSDVQWRQGGWHIDVFHFPNAGCIDPMVFREVETGTVVLGPAARPAVNG
jgi:hypothetical protein